MSEDKIFFLQTIYIRLSYKYIDIFVNENVNFIFHINYMRRLNLNEHDNETRMLFKFGGKTLTKIYISQANN